MENFERIKKTLTDLQALTIPSQYDLERVEEYVKALFTFARFKVEDEVQMADTYPVSVDESWGWMAHRHLLMKGSQATVKEVDWSSGSFCYMVLFENNSWMDDEGNIHPSDRPGGLFCLREKWLTKRRPKQ